LNNVIVFVSLVGVMYFEVVLSNAQFHFIIPASLNNATLQNNVQVEDNTSHRQVGKVERIQPNYGGFQEMNIVDRVRGSSEIPRCSKKGGVYGVL
jgi:hypothetical protein